MTERKKNPPTLRSGGEGRPTPPVGGRVSLRSNPSTSVRPGVCQLRSALIREHTRRGTEKQRTPGSRRGPSFPTVADGRCSRITIRTRRTDVNGLAARDDRPIEARVELAMNVRWRWE